MAVVIDKYGRPMTVRNPGAKAAIEEIKRGTKKNNSSHHSSHHSSNNSSNNSSSNNNISKPTQKENIKEIIDKEEKKEEFSGYKLKKFSNDNKFKDNNVTEYNPEERLEVKGYNTRGNAEDWENKRILLDQLMPEGKISGSVISATKKEDTLKGEEFRSSGTIKEFYYGTPINGQTSSEKTFKELRQEEVFLGGKNTNLFEQSPPKSTSKKILEETPIIGSGKKAIEAGRDMSKKVYAQTSFESSMGAGSASQKDSLLSIGKFGLQAGVFATDIVLVSGGVKYGVKVGKTALDRSLNKKLSIGIEELGKSPVITGTVKDTKSEKFMQEFSQKTNSFKRDGLIFGNIKEGREGIGFIPNGQGISFAGGTVEHKGMQKQFAKLLKTDTKKVWAENELFNIDTFGVSRDGKGTFGFETSRDTGYGIFTPIKKKTGVGGEGGAKIETQIGGQSIITKFKTPTFTKRFEKGSISYFEDKEGKGMQITTNLAKPKPSIISFTKDTGRNMKNNLPTFNEIKYPKKSGGTINEIKYPKKSGGTINEIKYTSQKTDITHGISKTLKGGFSENKFGGKPFQFMKQKIPKVGIAAGSLNLGIKSVNKLLFKRRFNTNQNFGTELTPKFSQRNSLKSVNQKKQITKTRIPIIKQPRNITNYNNTIQKNSNIIIPGFILPSLTTKQTDGVGKLAGFFKGKYTQSFAGYSFGIIGKTKGIKIRGKEIYTGMEIRGKKK